MPLEVDETPSPTGNHPDTIGPWRIGRTVGRDRVFAIRIARHLQSDTYAAVKIVPFSRFSPSPCLATSNDTLSDLEHELAVMKLISHPNILALYDTWESQRETFIITEYAGGGDLFSHLQKNNVQELSALATYFRQIMSAVAHCHSLRVTSHGLQPDSLLLNEAKGMIKLISFDTATLETNTSKLILGQRKDIWSCTVILFKLLSGEFELDIEMEPWAQFSPPFNRAGRPPELPHKTPRSARDLFDTMLMARNRNLKLTPISDLLTYSFFDFAPTLAVKREKPPPTVDLTAKTVDLNTYKELRVLLRHQLPEDAIQRNLLSKGSSFEKKVYTLLAAHRPKYPYFSDVYTLRKQSPSPDTTQHLQASGYATISMNESRILSRSKTQSPLHQVSPPVADFLSVQRGLSLRRISTLGKRGFGSAKAAISAAARKTGTSSDIHSPKQSPLDIVDQSLLGLGILHYPLPPNHALNCAIEHNDCQVAGNIPTGNSRIKHAQNVTRNGFEVRMAKLQHRSIDTHEISPKDNPDLPIGIVSPPTSHPEPPRSTRTTWRRLMKAKPRGHSYLSGTKTLQLRATDLTHEPLKLPRCLGVVVPGFSQVSASLLSAQDIRTTRDECIRLLQALGVLVDTNTVQVGTLRCELIDTADAADNPKIRKRLHFVIKISHVTSTSHLLAGFVSSLRLIKEKGPTASFKHIYNRLRHEWNLDNLSAIKGAGLRFRIVPSPAIIIASPTLKQFEQPAGEANSDLLLHPNGRNLDTVGFAEPPHFTHAESP